MFFRRAGGPLPTGNPPPPPFRAGRFPRGASRDFPNQRGATHVLHLAPPEGRSFWWLSGPSTGCSVGRFRGTCFATAPALFFLGAPAAPELAVVASPGTFPIFCCRHQTTAKKNGPRSKTPAAARHSSFVRAALPRRTQRGFRPCRGRHLWRSRLSCGARRGKPLLSTHPQG